MCNTFCAAQNGHAYKLTDIRLITESIGSNFFHRASGSLDTPILHHGGHALKNKTWLYKGFGSPVEVAKQFSK